MKLENETREELKEVGITMADIGFRLNPVPSLLDVLKRNGVWKNLYDEMPPSEKGLMTENIIDHFHINAVETVDRLNHAGYTPDQISMETGLMPAKIDVVLESIGVNPPTIPDNVRQAYKENGDGDAVDKAFPPQESKLPPWHLWEVKHSYYGEAQYDEMNFDSWEDFLDSMGKADKDYNYLIRWDWYERNREFDIVTYKGDDNERTGYVKFIYHAQRKGFTMSAIVKVCRNDEPKVRKYLEENWNHMESMWAPVSNGTSELVPQEELSARTPEQLVENQYTEITSMDDSSEAQEIVRNAIGDFDPNSVKWVKYKFSVEWYNEISPAVFPPAGPFWYDRPEGGFTTKDWYEVTAYLPEGVPFERYWPNVKVAASYENLDRIIYPVNPNYRYYQTSDREGPSMKPKWWPY